MRGHHCKVCRLPLRGQRGAVHVGCKVPPALADDIYAKLKLRFPVTNQRLADDFGVGYGTMTTAIKMAGRRLRDQREVARHPARGAA